MTKAHEQHETFHDNVEYPEHENRTESSEFRHNRITLLKHLKLGCWICDSKEHLEVHHLIEWALWNKIDPEKMLHILRCFDPYRMTHNNPEELPKSPDDIRNLLVLCGRHSQDEKIISGGHHRGVDIGIHRIPFPIFLAIGCVKEGQEIVDPIDVKSHGTSK